MSDLKELADDAARKLERVGVEMQRLAPDLMVDLLLYGCCGAKLDEHGHVQRLPPEDVTVAEGE